MSNNKFISYHRGRCTLHATFNSAKRNIGTGSGKIYTISKPALRKHKGSYRELVETMEPSLIII